MAVPLAWELPYAPGAAQKKKNKTKSSHGLGEHGDRGGVLSVKKSEREILSWLSRNKSD